jgi:bacterioferritin-associated ferredoxin
LITFLIIVILVATGVVMYLCLCKGLTESDVQRLCPKTPQSPDAVVARLGLEDDDCCGRCARNIHEFLAFTTPVSP